MRPPPVTAAPPSTTEQTISRTEWYWLLGAILFGAILRLSFPGRMAVEHFDEGVYASNFWFEVEQGGEYPARHLYAPPLLPMAIEWTMIVASLCGIKPTGFIPMIPSLIAGLATIPSMWWVGRRWFGPSAGIVAAWLVAASDFHASYSRAALTDVPVCLFMLWGVYFIWQALQTGTRRDILLAGLFTGLAWWTKYNGWLPLAIGLSGGAAWQLSLPRADRRLRQFATRWSLVALTAFAIWSPVLWGLQKHGGYAVVAANHRQYVVGITGWTSSALRQLTHVGLYDNWLGVGNEAYLVQRRKASAARLEKFVVTTFDSPYIPSETRAIELLDHRGVSDEVLHVNVGVWDIITWNIFASQFGRCLRPTLILGGAVCLFLAASLGVIWMSVRHRRAGSALQMWMCMAWLFGMTVATPFYHPYPRLVLPWLMAVWMSVGLTTNLLTKRDVSPSTPFRGHASRWQPHWIEISFIAWLVVCGSTRCGLGTAHAWQDRSAMKTVADKVTARIREKTRASGYPENEAIVYILGEPAFLFHLRAAGLPLATPIQNLAFLSTSPQRPTFFLTTNHGTLATDVEQELRNRQEAWSGVSILNPNFRPSHLVCYDTPLSFDDPCKRLRDGSSVILGRVRD